MSVLVELLEITKVLRLAHLATALVVITAGLVMMMILTHVLAHMLTTRWLNIVVLDLRVLQKVDTVVVVLAPIEELVNVSIA